MVHMPPSCCRHACVCILSVNAQTHIDPSGQLGAIVICFTDKETEVQKSYLLIVIDTDSKEIDQTPLDKGILFSLFFYLHNILVNVSL